MPLPEDVWHHSPLIRGIDTDHIQRCVARNVGAALAGSKYLHCLDADDRLLPSVAAVGMGVTESTTNQHHAGLEGQQTRELILNEFGVYRRLAVY